MNMCILNYNDQTYCFSHEHIKKKLIGPIHIENVKCFQNFSIFTRHNNPEQKLFPLSVHTILFKFIKHRVTSGFATRLLSNRVGGWRNPIEINIFSRFISFCESESYLFLHQGICTVPSQFFFFTFNFTFNFSS